MASIGESTYAPSIAFFAEVLPAKQKPKYFIWEKLKRRKYVKSMHKFARVGELHPSALERVVEKKNDSYN